jgi:hypothetical protein
MSDPVTLADRDGRGHKLKLFRASNGQIYCEVEAKHNGHIVCSALRLGESWELLPALAGLR